MRHSYYIIKKETVYSITDMKMFHSMVEYVSKPKMIEGVGTTYGIVTVNGEMSGKAMEELGLVEYKEV